MKLPRLSEFKKWPTGLDGDKSRKLKSILWTYKCQGLQTEQSKDISITFPTGIAIAWIWHRKSCRLWLIPESNSADRKYISNWKQHDAINCDRHHPKRREKSTSRCIVCLFKDDDSSF
jgi:hypothetical protein